MPARSEPPGLTSDQLRDRRACIARAGRRGMTVANAAARFNVTTRNVYTACREHGVRFGVGGVGRSASVARRDRAIAKAAKGREPAASIAERLGLPEATVRSACERMGVRPVPGTGSRHARSLAVRRGLRKQTKALLRAATPRTREIVRLMLATDWTMDRIAAECGVSGQRVNEVWRRAVRIAAYRIPGKRPPPAMPTGLFRGGPVALPGLPKGLAPPRARSENQGGNP